MVRVPVDPAPDRRPGRRGGVPKPDLRDRIDEARDARKQSRDERRDRAETPKRRGALWRYRWQLTPVFVAAGLWVMAGLMELWPPAAALLAAAALVTLLGFRRFNLRGEELLYGRMVVATGCAWTFSAALVGSNRPGVVLAWLLLTVAAGVPWWRHRRIRGRIRVDRTIEAWPEWTAQAGYPGVRAVYATAGRVSDRIRLEVLRGKQRVSTLVTDVESFASVRGIPLWRIRFDQEITKTDPGLVDLLLTHTDLWRDNRGQAIDLPHPAIADPGGWSRDRSICQPVPYGESDDGGLAEVRLRTKAGGRVIAVVAMKGGGKTVILRNLVGAGVTMTDVDIVWIDHKERGKASEPWRKHLYARATSPAEAVAVLSRIIQDGAQRGADSPDAVLQPTPERRTLLVIVDEYGALVQADPRIGDLVEVIARTFRSISGTIIIADQHVDQSAWSGALRGQIDEVLVGRMQSRRAVRQILPGSLEVDPSDFAEDMHGQVVQRAGKAGTVLIRRAWHLEDQAHIAAMLEHLPERQEAGSAAAEVLEGETDEAVPAPRRNQARTAARQAALTATIAGVVEAAEAPRGADLSVDELRTIAMNSAPPPATAESSALDQRILKEIRKAGEGGVSTGELVDRLVDVPRSTVQLQCRLMRRAGQLVTRPARGRHARWHLTESSEPVMSNA